MKLSNNSFKGVEQYIELKLNDYFNKAAIKTLTNLIFSELLGISKQSRLINPQNQLSEGELLLVIRSVNRLLKHEPIDYIIGNTAFFGRTFKVNSSVLIPRPETEELCEWIIAKETSPNLKFADIGTGSGCIAITLAKELIQPTAYACDVSEDALVLVQQNIELNKANVVTKCFDVLKDFPINEKLDFIVSNPPYVLESDKIEMEQNVLDYEPHLALFVEDKDPLLFYRKVAEHGLNHLKQEGRLYFEVHERYANEVAELLQAIGYGNLEVRKDAQRKERMVGASMRL